MSSWKQRLYAFLLRRLLEPVLDEDSLCKLQDTLSVSLQDGRLTLTDLGLDAEALNQRLAAAAKSPKLAGALRVRHVRMQRLQVRLSLEEPPPPPASSSNDDDDAKSAECISTNTAAPTTTSWAWRAWQLGYGASSTSAGNDGGGVALLAAVELDGVDLEVQPAEHPPEAATTSSTPTSPSPEPNSDDIAAAQQQTKSLLASYLEAALSSLRLTVQIRQLCLRVVSTTPTVGKNPVPLESIPAPSIPSASLSPERQLWVEVRLKAASYHDAPIPRSAGTTSATIATSSYETVMHKSLEMSHLVVLTGYTTASDAMSGSDQTSPPDTIHNRTPPLKPATTTKAISMTTTTTTTTTTTHTLALLEGTTQIRLRAIEYNAGSTMQTSQHGPTSNTKVQQDLEVTFSQKLSVSLDQASLLHLKQVLNDFTLSKTTVTTGRTNVTTVSTPKRDFQTDWESAASNLAASSAQADLETLDAIMKQYQEARALAERKQVRGGILVPSSAELDTPGNAGGGDVGDITFDVFFDANDQSFYRYSTLLQESVLAANSDTKGNALSHGDWVHTKVRLFIPQGSVKLAFVDPRASLPSARPPDEYVLMTFRDMNLTSAVSFTSSDYAFGVGHFEIEDSQKVVGDTQGAWGSSAAIGSMLRFGCDDHAEHDDDGDDGASGVLVEAPNISLRVKIEQSDSRLVDVELAMEPLELTYQHRTIDNLCALRQILSTNGGGTEASSQEEPASTRDENQSLLKVYATCPSITVELPLVEVGPRRNWSQVFDRGGYYCDSPQTTKNSLGLFFDNIAFEMNGQESMDEDVALLCCHYVWLHASAPEVGRVVGRQARRLDILGFCGRTEVNPCIPVSVKIVRCRAVNPKDDTASSESGSNAGASSFPRVPAISSFKARQQDEDEDNRIDRVLTSKLRDLTFETRRGLRGADPQADMIRNASKSDIVVECSIPEFVVDLSRQEITELKTMLDLALPTAPSLHDTPPDSSSRISSPKPEAPVPAVVSFAVDCKFMSLTVHEDGSLVQKEKDATSRSTYAYAIKLDDFKMHLLSARNSIQHLRAFAQELDLFEVTRPLVGKVENVLPRGAGGRRNNLLERGTDSSIARATPLLYRSHLFEPISRQSPSILIDLVVAPAEDEECLKKRSLYVTLYDLTYRYDVDSRWIERLTSLMKSGTEQGDHVDESNDDTETDTSTLTRVFVTAADCNVDYSSSQRFQHPSRLILRLGDFRFSSNVMWPRSPVQTFSLSVGDVSVYLCRTRFPYHFENSRLVRAEAIMRDDQLSTPPNSSPESVMKAMDYRTIVMLDSVDAVVAKSNVTPKSASDPWTRVSITAGDLNMFACKDSFLLFQKSIGELSTELTSLDENSFRDLTKRAPVEEAGAPKDEQPDSVNDLCDEDEATLRRYVGLDDLRKQSALRPAARTSSQGDIASDFLLDGYDWTTICLDEANDPRIPLGEEQSARWYGTENSAAQSGQDGMNVSGLSVPVSGMKPHHSGPRLISHHFPLHPVSDPVSDGDMGAAKYAGIDRMPQVKTRILLHDVQSVRFRFFDGYDFPTILDEEDRHPPADGSFVINEQTNAVDEAEDDKHEEQDPLTERKSKLMGDLLDGALVNADTFVDTPLPEDRGRMLKEQATLRRFSRRSSKYFQIAALGVSLRMDSFEESTEHQLKSCMHLMAKDFFLAETISSERPVKMIGEWLNDAEHPRDSKEGLLMMKMVTWSPRSSVTSDNLVANDESEAALTILPLRCRLDQRAIRFARAFFQSESKTEEEEPPVGRSATGLYTIPPPIFRMLRVRPAKLKVDYQPQVMNTKALRDGALVELINLSPLEGMVLTLQMVEVENEVGLGSAIGVMVRRWIQDICSTQLIKFLTNSRPLEPITHVGGSASDMLILPWDAFQNGESIQKALKAGITSFARAVTYEAFTMTSRAAEFVASHVGRTSGQGTTEGFSSSRPLGVPRGLTDATPYAVESITRGLQTANYKIVIIPYREYRKSGATGAVRSVLKGIPVAIAAPASGAAEALSFALLGARNQLRPDIRMEDEASLRGLHLDGT